MFMDDELLTPYIAAVKKARLELHAISLKAPSNSESNIELIHAEKAYEQACKELAEITSSCTEPEELENH